MIILSIKLSRKVLRRILYNGTPIRKSLRTPRMWWINFIGDIQTYLAEQFFIILRSLI